MLPESQVKKIINVEFIKQIIRARLFPALTYYSLQKLMVIKMG